MRARVVELPYQGGACLASVYEGEDGRQLALGGACAAASDETRVHGGSGTHAGDAKAGVMSPDGKKASVEGSKGWRFRKSDLPLLRELVLPSFMEAVFFRFTVEFEWSEESLQGVMEECKMASDTELMFDEGAPTSPTARSSGGRCLSTNLTASAHPHAQGLADVAATSLGTPSDAATTIFPGADISVLGASGDKSGDASISGGGGIPSPGMASLSRTDSASSGGAGGLGGGAGKAVLTRSITGSLGALTKSSSARKPAFSTRQLDAAQALLSLVNLPLALLAQGADVGVAEKELCEALRVVREFCTSGLPAVGGGIGGGNYAADAGASGSSHNPSRLEGSQDASGDVVGDGGNVGALHQAGDGARRALLAAGILPLLHSLMKLPERVPPRAPSPLLAPLGGMADEIVASASSSGDGGPQGSAAVTPRSPATASTTTTTTTFLSPASPDRAPQNVQLPPAISPRVKAQAISVLAGLLRSWDASSLEAALEAGLAAPGSGVDGGGGAMGGLVVGLVGGIGATVMGASGAAGSAGSIPRQVLDEEPGLVASLMRLLHVRAAASSVRGCAAAAVAGLASSLPEVRDALAAAGAIPQLVEMLYDGDAHGKGRAAQALGALAWDAGNRRAIGEVGAVAPLMEVMRRQGDVHGRAYGALLVGSLADVPVRRQALLRAGALAILVSMLREEHPPNVTPSFIPLPPYATATTTAPHAPGLPPRSNSGRALRPGGGDHGFLPRMTTVDRRTSDPYGLDDDFPFCPSGGLTDLEPVLAFGKGMAVRALAMLCKDEEQRSLVVGLSVMPTVELLRSPYEECRIWAARALRHFMAKGGAGTEGGQDGNNNAGLGGGGSLGILPKMAAPSAAMGPSGVSASGKVLDSRDVDGGDGSGITALSVPGMGSDSVGVVARVAGTGGSFTSKGGAGAIRSALVASGGIKLLVAMLRLGPDRARVEAALVLDTFAADSNANRVVVGQAGAVPALVEMMRVGNEGARDVAAGMCWNLAWSDYDGGALVQAGAIPLFVQILRTGTEQGKMHASGCFWNLAWSGRNCEAIGRAGGVETLVEYLRTSTGAEGRAWAARALASLAKGHKPNGDALVKAGGLSPLVDLLKGNSQGQVWAARALANVAVGHEDRCRLIVRHGAIPHLIGMLASATPEGKVMAAGVLWNLAWNLDHGRQIVAAGGIRPLRELLDVPSSEGRMAAAGVLWNLAWDVDNGLAIVNAGAVPPLVQLASGAGPTQERLWAARALGSLAGGHPDNGLSIAHAGGLAPMALLLRAGQQQERAAAAVVIWSMACHCADASNAVGAGMLPVTSPSFSQGDRFGRDQGGGGMPMRPGVLDEHTAYQRPPQQGLGIGTLGPQGHAGGGSGNAHHPHAVKEGGSLDPRILMACIPGLAQLLVSDASSDDSRRVAAGALAALARINPACQAAVARAQGVIPALVQLLRNTRAVTSSTASHQLVGLARAPPRTSHDITDTHSQAGVMPGGAPSPSLAPSAHGGGDRGSQAPPVLVPILSSSTSHQLVGLIRSKVSPHERLEAADALQALADGSPANAAAIRAALADLPRGGASSGAGDDVASFVSHALSWAGAEPTNCCIQ
eukprot:jgi/Mesvir1/12929/Mv05948-RA.1